jgi:hypothetical protein
MNTICAYCGQPDPGAAQAIKAPRLGDYYPCAACGKLSVFTENGLRKATKTELEESSRDWRAPRTGIPAMIGFDARG